MNPQPDLRNRAVLGDNSEKTDKLEPCREVTLDRSRRNRTQRICRNLGWYRIVPPEIKYSDRIFRRPTLVRLEERPLAHMIDREVPGRPPRREAWGVQMRDLQAPFGMILDAPAHDGCIPTGAGARSMT